MAISTTGQINGTTVTGSLTITASNRTNTGFTLSFSHLLTMGGYVGANLETYTAYITVSGTGITSKTVTMTVKPKATGLSSGATLTTTSSASFVTTSASALTATVSFYIHTDNSDYSSTVNTTAGTGTVSIPVGSIIPTAPTISLKASPSNSSSCYYIGYNPDSKVVITCSGGSNIAKYKYQYSVGNGWVDIATTTSSSYTATNSQFTEMAAGKTLSFQVIVYSSTNNTATAQSKYLRFTYRTSSAPTKVTLETDVSLSSIAYYTGYVSDSKITIRVNGGTNVSSYQYQVSANSGTYITIATTSSTSYDYYPSDVSTGDTLSFRVCVVGLDGNNSSYTAASTIITVKYVDGIYKLVNVYVNVDGVYKTGRVYSNIDGVWKKGMPIYSK